MKLTYWQEDWLVRIVWGDKHTPRPIPVSYGRSSQALQDLVSLGLVCTEGGYWQLTDAGRKEMEIE